MRKRISEFICRVRGHKPASMTFTCLRCGEYAIPLAEQIARTLARKANRR